MISYANHYQMRCIQHDTTYDIYICTLWHMHKLGEDRGDIKGLPDIAWAFH